ncbi:MAG: hypothetical protein HND47_13710 [Chloroflexi bacterium]|nr:hypothetical protein [Chloroflexota bacterium]
MKRALSLIAFAWMIALLAVLFLPPVPVGAEIVAKTIKVGSLSTQRGSTSGDLSVMKKKDQSGTADNPARYVLFSTPGTIYRGTRVYTLPAYIRDSNIETLRLRVNVKAPSHDSQRWIWRVFDWDAGKWETVGSNSVATANTWSLLTFNFPQSPDRFINSSGQVKIQFRSTNASGDAKIDSEFVLATFDYQYSGCGEILNEDFENEMLTRINNQRSANGNLPALTRDARLDAASRQHSTDMACNDFFDHTNLLGVPFNVRITNQGYNYWYAGENIAAGYSTPAAIVTAWMNSSGHRANILSTNYTQIGIGYAYYSGSTYGHYWTTDFASPAP